MILGSRLRQQVVGTTVALTLIAMAALTLLVHEVLASTVEGDVSGLLQDRADAVTATLTERDGQVVVPEIPTAALGRGQGSPNQGEESSACLQSSADTLDPPSTTIDNKEPT